MNDFEKIEEKASTTRNQYLLSLAMAKRVRSLRSGAPTLVEGIKGRVEPIRAAMAEFAGDMIAYRIPNHDGGGEN
ncbi:MAG: DNA-directed RNA polymerase subunit omega [Candidatus Fermentibacterota bacterium]